MAKWKRINAARFYKNSSEGGPKNIVAMTRIASSSLPVFPKASDPHSVDSGLYTFEKGLRITAIETLDQWGAKGVQVLPSLVAIRESQHERDLQFLTSLAISGIQEGRPGKSNSFY